jgi:nicotinate-nucleotide adenylyltransferase
MPERIGIFGGTFDPPHLGHLILAGEAFDQLSLTRLLWMLTPRSPHKLEQDIANAEQRIAMLQRAIRDDPRFELSTLELGRPAPQYSIDTLLALRDLHPTADLILLIGGDHLRGLPAWHRPADLVRACRELGVMRRPEEVVQLDALEEAIPGLREKVRFVDAPLLEISSREIRKRIAEGREVRYYLPPAVYEYILEQRLYRN